MSSGTSQTLPDIYYMCLWELMLFISFQVQATDFLFQ